MEGCQDSSKIDGYLNALGFSSTSSGIPSRQDHFLFQHDGSNEGAENNGSGTGSDELTGDLRAMNPMLWIANTAELEEWLENSDLIADLI